MNYLLAKELRAAGWPQYKVPEGMPQPACAHPSLEELILALGDKFDSLDNTYDGWRVYYGGNLSTDFVWDKEMTSAVAKAWLALNTANPIPHPSTER